MHQTWHPRELPEIIGDRRANHEIEIHHESFLCWSFWIWANDGEYRRCWAAGITSTRRAAERVTRRWVERAALPGAPERFRCDIVERLGWCTGEGCWPSGRSTRSRPSA